MQPRSLKPLCWRDFYVQQYSSVRFYVRDAMPTKPTNFTIFSCCSRGFGSADSAGIRGTLVRFVRYLPSGFTGMQYCDFLLQISHSIDEYHAAHPSLLARTDDLLSWSHAVFSAFCCWFFRRKDARAFRTRREIPGPLPAFIWPFHFRLRITDPVAEPLVGAPLIQTFIFYRTLLSIRCISGSLNSTLFFWEDLYNSLFC